MESEQLTIITDLTGIEVILKASNLDAHTLGAVLLMAEEYTYEELARVVPFCMRFMQTPPCNSETWFIPYLGSFCHRMKQGINDNRHHILNLIAAAIPEDLANWSDICNSYVIRQIDEDDDGQLLANVGEFKRIIAAVQAQREIDDGESSSYGDSDYQR